MSEQQDLRARLLEECDRKENIPTRVPTMNPRTRLVHSDRVRDLLREAAAQLGRVGEIEEDEDGMPVGYADWYNAHYAGQHVDTSRDHACESAWRAALTAQQKAPEGEEECETCEGRGWHDERLGGYSFSNPKAPCPDCDGTGQLSDSAAPGGDVETRGHIAMLRSLRLMYEDGVMGEGDHVGTISALDAAIAALSAPKQVRVEEVERLRAERDAANAHRSRTITERGRFEYALKELVPHLYEKIREAAYRRPYVDDDHSEFATFVRTLSPQAAPVPVEGEGFVFDEKLSAILAKLRTANDDDKPAIVREAIERLRGQNRDGPPPSQPAVELEQFRPAVEALEREGRKSEVKDGVLHWTLNAKHYQAQELFALIDGAKAGKGEGHE